MAGPIVSAIGVGPEFRIPGVEALDPSSATAPAGGGFGQMLAGSIEKLQGMVQDASQQSTALATGQATDLSSVVLSVERAALGLQLAVQVRNKAVEAYQDLFRMQI